MPPTRPACRGATRSTITRIMVGIDNPMPRPISTRAGTINGQGGTKPAAPWVTTSAVATAPVADSTKPSDGAEAPSQRPMAALKVEAMRKPAENGRIASPACHAVKPSADCR